VIAFDIETFDPGLKESGPGVYRRDGNILGVSYALDSGERGYLDLGHPGLDTETRAENKRRVERLLSTDEEKVGANLLYDVDWLENFEGIKVQGILNDIQVAEPLIDEYAMSYSLDALGYKYLKRGKAKTLIDLKCEELGLKGPSVTHLYRFKAKDAEEYAIEDAVLAREIFEKQKPIMEEEDLVPLYKIESGLLPLLMSMRKNGIRIDRERQEDYARTLRKKISTDTLSLYKEYGAFNINSTAQVAEICDGLGLQYSVTEKGNASIKKEDLERMDHPFAKRLIDLKEASVIFNNFIDGAFVEYAVNGRIHCQFFPLRRDEGGTVSGRFSSQNPNLQQVPGRDEDYARECRGLFLPEDGCWYGKIDYSQIEYRFIAHYAKGPKSDVIQEQYRNDPKTDYHKLVMGWTGVDRFTAKRLNFGMAYFMGANSMSRKFNWSVDHAKDLVNLYHNTVPFMRPTREAVVAVAKGRGYIHTFLGRRARVSKEMRENKKEYVMFNRLIQGSAADLLKKSMYDAYTAGIFNVLTPHLTVHDELGVSVPKTPQGVDAYEELKHIMETSITLRVPIVADAEIGPNWGETKDCDFDELRKEL
jgi:DNA polymerase I-like protein with 3'-5' exonuclease and polymerase domains